ncbi:helix-turn-helix domain-containing protein [Azospirillum sp. sgz302134]
MTPNRIRHFRKLAGLTLEELAARIGMSNGNLSRLERGQIAWTQPTLESLARELGCRVIDLIDEGSGSGTLDAELLGTVLEAVLDRLGPVVMEMPKRAVADLVVHVYQEAQEVAPDQRIERASTEADAITRWELRRKRL